MFCEPIKCRQLTTLPSANPQRPPIDKTLIFYGVRATLGLLSAACEATFVDAVTRRFGARPGVLTFLLLLTSAGVFQVRLRVNIARLIRKPSDLLLTTSTQHHDP